MIIYDRDMQATPEFLLQSDIVKMVAHFEGFSSTPYKCPAGYWTIGYGRVIDSNDHKDIEFDEGLEYLSEDLMRSVKAVTRLCPNLLTDEGYVKQEHVYKFLALVSFTYNLGEGNLGSSTLRKEVLKENWEQASKEFLRWDKARVNGKLTQLAGLTKRRKAEAQFFLTGEFNSTS